MVWGKISKWLLAIAVTVLLILVAFFDGKTIWDVLDLIIVPVILSIIAYELAKSQREKEHKIADDHTSAATMRAYQEEIANLLVEKRLRDSGVDSELRGVARAHTIRTLFEIDGKRKGRLIQFLFEEGLIDARKRVSDKLSEPWEEAIISLNKADLTKADLKWAFLPKVDLNAVNLEDADLRGTILSDAHLYQANLRNADLRDAVLKQADLRNTTLCNADLRGATLTGADLRGADLTGFKWDRETNFKLVQIEKTKGIEGISIPPGPIGHFRAET